MKKGDVIGITAPNGAVISAVILDAKWEGYRVNIDDEPDTTYGKWECICYAQNRLFYFTDRVNEERRIPVYEPSFYYVREGIKHIYEIGETICEYCVIPFADTILDSTRNFEEEI